MKDLKELRKMLAEAKEMKKELESCEKSQDFQFDLFGSVINGINSVISGIGNAIKNITSAIYDGIKSLLNGINRLIGFIGKVIKSLLNGIKRLTDFLLNGINRLVRSFNYFMFSDSYAVTEGGFVRKVTSTACRFKNFLTHITNKAFKYLIKLSKHITDNELLVIYALTIVANLIFCVVGINYYVIPNV